jgi:hypothetical protein
MGLLKIFRNFNNAEGRREGIRVAYRKGYRAAQRQGVTPHQNALFSALNACWETKNYRPNEALLSAEIAPFACMAPEVGREALAEYLVCIERPEEGRIGWLREQLNSALTTPYDSQEARYALDDAAKCISFFGSDLLWIGMLQDEVLQSLREHAREFDAAQEEGVADLHSIDTLAAALRVPPEVFALNEPLEGVLRSWSKAELLVLDGRILNFRRSENISDLHGALEMLSNRLKPLLPDSAEEIDPEAMKQALFKLYEDR